MCEGTGEVTTQPGVGAGVAMSVLCEQHPLPVLPWLLSSFSGYCARCSYDSLGNFKRSRVIAIYSIWNFSGVYISMGKPRI